MFDFGGGGEDGLNRGDMDWWVKLDFSFVILMFMFCRIIVGDFYWEIGKYLICVFGCYVIYF